MSAARRARLVSGQGRTMSRMRSASSRTSTCSPPASKPGVSSMCCSSRPGVHTSTFMAARARRGASAARRTPEVEGWRHGTPAGTLSQPRAALPAALIPPGRAQARLQTPEPVAIPRSAVTAREEPALDAQCRARTVDALLLLVHALAADEQPGGQVVPGAHAAQLVKDLHRELARRRDDQAAQPVVAAPAQPVQLLQQLRARAQLDRSAPEGSALGRPPGWDREPQQGPAAGIQLLQQLRARRSFAAQPRRSALGWDRKPQQGQQLGHSSTSSCARGAAAPLGTGAARWGAHPGGTGSPSTAQGGPLTGSLTC